MHISSTNYTSTTPIMSWCSFKIKPRTERVKNGYAPLVLQLFIQKKKVVIDLGAQVQPHTWDKTKMECKGRAEEAQRINILVENIKASIHNIQLDHRLQNRTLTAESFKESFLNRSSRADFVEFWQKKLQERYQSGEITHSSYCAQKAVYSKFRGQYKSLAFAEFNLQTLENYHKFLRGHYKKINPNVQHQNSIHGQFKVIKTYARLAEKSGIKFDNPFLKFKVKPGSGRIIYLSETELKIMLNAWQNKVLNPSDHYALTVFIFSCYSSLRISDIKQLHAGQIINNQIILQPQKTRRQNKTIVIPLNNISRKILANQPGQYYFNKMSEQKINIHLKTVAAILGIKKNITMHVGRHTFATEFLRRGGQIHVLQKIMGHADIKTTMVYTHLDAAHLAAQMQIMDD